MVPGRPLFRCDAACSQAFCQVACPGRRPATACTPCKLSAQLATGQPCSVAFNMPPRHRCSPAAPSVDRGAAIGGANLSIAIAALPDDLLTRCLALLTFEERWAWLRSPITQVAKWSDPETLVGALHAAHTCSMLALDYILASQHNLARIAPAGSRLQPWSASASGQRAWHPSCCA